MSASHAIWIALVTGIPPSGHLICLEVVAVVFTKIGLADTLLSALLSATWKKMLKEEGERISLHHPMCSTQPGTFGANPFWMLRSMPNSR